MAQATPEDLPPIPPWLPNAISVLRILLVPGWLACAEAARASILAGHPDAATWRWGAVSILLAIGISDVVDGFLARRFHLESRTGATLDAFADKLAQVGVLLFFTVRSEPAFGSTPVWFLGLILLRDVVMLSGWLALRRHLKGRVAVVHQIHGKAASTLIFALMVLLTADVGRGWIHPLVWLITAIVLWSTADYVRAGFAQRQPTAAGNGS